MWALLYLTAVGTLTYGQVVPDILTTSGSTANPGAQLRLTQRGVDYINDVFTSILNDQLGKLHIAEISKVDERGHLLFKDLHTTTYKAPDSTKLDLIAPNRISWTMRNMDLALSANADVDYNIMIHIQGKGTLTVTGRNLNFDLAAAISRTSDGRPQLKTTDCKVQIGSLDGDAQGEGNAIPLFQQYKPLLIQYIKPLIERKACEAVREHVDEDLNKKLSTLGMKAPLRSNYTCDTGLLDDDCSKVDNQIDLNELYFDYSLIKDPIVTEDYLQTEHKAEINYKNGPPTPFGPAPMQIHPNDDQMLHVFLSDYIFNSMFYNLFRSERTVIDFSAQKTPKFAPFLRLNCSSSEICLGTIIPEMAKKFPNHEAEIRLQATEMPYGIFQQDLLRILMKNTVGFYPRNRERNLREFALLCDLNVTAITKDLAVDQNTQKITGHSQVEQTTFAVKNSRVGNIPSSREKDLKVIAEELVQSGISSRMSEGIPLPRINMVQWTNTHASASDRTFTVDTDAQVDMEKLKAEVDKRIQTALSRQGVQLG